MSITPVAPISANVAAPRVPAAVGNRVTDGDRAARGATGPSAALELELSVLKAALGAAPGSVDVLA
jgi:hypothetical protein